MNKVEILLEINKLNIEIKSLTAEKTKYENMKSKINETISKLKNVNQYLDESYKQLKNNYSSDESVKKLTNLKSDSTKVGKIINELNGTILIETNAKIKSLNNQIQNKEKERQQLREQLEHM